MFQYLVLALAAFAACVEADDPTTTSAPTPTKTDSDAPATHTVKVGYPGFNFTPNTTIAKVGDTIAFKFYPPDHSVIRANFHHGCIPYERVGANSVGFYSGVQFLNGISEDGPVFNVRVNDTEPIFFYCGAPNSCKGKHMIGVINPNDTWTLDEHLKRVEEAEFELTPNQDWPSEQEKPDDYNENFNKTSSTAAPSSGSNKTDDKSNTDDDNHGSHHLSAGAIAGISIGSAAVLILAGTLIYLCGRRGGFDKAYRKSGGSFQPNTMGSFNAGHMGTPMIEQKGSPHKMHEAWGGGPQTPGAGAINGYAAVPNSEGTYRDGGVQGSPQLNGGFGPRSPMSPQQGYGGYTGTIASNITHNDNGTYMGQVTPHVTPPPPTESGGRPSGGPPPPSGQPPIELPTSNDPGNSPLQSYPRQFSWAQGSETNYRPAKS